MVINMPPGRIDDSQLHAVGYGYQKLFTRYYILKFIIFFPQCHHMPLTDFVVSLPVVAEM
jgi:hypothetical protein